MADFRGSFKEGDREVGEKGLLPALLMIQATKQRPVEAARFRALMRNTPFNGTGLQSLSKRLSNAQYRNLC